MLGNVDYKVVENIQVAKMDSTVMTAFTKAGKEMGYEGEELRKWVTEQCEVARELRSKGKRTETTRIRNAA